MTAQELADMLYRRFKGVPGFTEDEALELVEDAMLSHGISPDKSVPSEDVSLIMLYAQYQGAWLIAMSTAHYFRFTDGEESVDKSKVADNYRRLARDLKADYEAEKGRILGNNFTIMPRFDRPNTTPPSGESWRRPWRNY